MLSADELLGKVHIPLTPASRVHIMPDEPESEPLEYRSMSDRILEWCRFHTGFIDAERVAADFSITVSQAGCYLQRFGRRGFLERSHRIKRNGRSMQVWKWYFREIG